MARARADAEEVTLRLRQEVSGPAAAATAAAQQMTAEIEGATAALRAMQAQSRVKALGELEQQIAHGTGALKDLQAQMRAMQKGPVVDIEQYRKLKGEIDAQTSALNRAKGEHSALAGFAKKSGAESAAGAKKASAGMSEATKAARLLGGEAGASAASVVSFAQELVALGPYAIAAGVGLAVLAAGVVALVGFFLSGIKAADGFRNELLRLQGAMRGNAEAGKQAQSAINAVAGSAFNALPREKLAEYATQLGQMRVRGKDLQTALEAAAIAGSASGDAMAQSVLGAAAAASRAGQSVDALAQRIKRQLGGVAASQAFSLDAQFRRMREDVTQLFAGAQLDPFLSGLKNITSMFSATSESGQKLQGYVSGAFNKLLAIATAALPYVKGAMLGAGIAALTMYIAVKQIYNAIRDWAAPLIKATGLFDDATVAIEAGKVAAYALTGAFVAAGLAIAIAMLPLTILLGAIGLAVYAVVKAVGFLVDAGVAVATWLANAFASAKDALSNISLADIAANMIRTFIGGITGSIGDVRGALSSMGDAAVSGLKGALGIHSPSRAATEAAENVTHTFTTKIDDAEPDVRASFDTFAMPSPEQVKGEAKAARANGGAKIIYIEMGSGKDRGELGLLEKLRELLRQEFDAEVRVVEPMGGVA